MRLSRRQMLVGSIALASLTAFPSHLFAHLATFGSWDTTKKYLKQLFPAADSFLVKKGALSSSQAESIEKRLGFELYPEDRNPTFYVATQTRDGQRRVLGVAVFIDPRVTSDLTSTVTRLEVGIGVDCLETSPQRALGLLLFHDLNL